MALDIENEGPLKDDENIDDILCKYDDYDSIYNMVGVAVAMVISTMHEKSCIDSHNARKFE